MKKSAYIVVAVVVIAVIVVAGFYANKKRTTPPETVQYASLAEVEKDIARLEPFFKSKSLSWQDAYRLGVAYMQAGRIEDAMAALADSERRHPEFFKTYESLGMAHFRLGDMDKALVNWERALALDPKAEHIKEMIERARHRKATTDRILALEAEVKDARAEWGKRFELAVLYLTTGKINESHAMLTGLLKAKKDSPELYSALARAEAMMGNIDASIANQRKAVKLRPNDAAMQRILADLERFKKEGASPGRQKN